MVIQAIAAARIIALEETGSDGVYVVPDAGLRHQPGPWAAQCLLEPGSSGYENIDTPGFNLLDGAYVDVDLFRQLFLRDIPCGSFAANVRAEFLQLSLDSRVFWHAPLGRFPRLTRTAQWGVISFG
jgi:hypothetical protein